MAFSLHFVEDVLNAAVGSDDERGAGDAHHFLPVHILLFDHAESVAGFLVGIAEQGVGQVVFVLKFLLPIYGIGGDAENDGAGGLDFLVCVAEPARFKGSTGGVRFGEKEENDGLAGEVLEHNLAAVLVL
jgi:hypothetical protein